LGDLYVPRVTLDFVRQGNINPEARSSGTVRAADTEQIFAPVSGRITQIAEPGETVNAQTVLFTITSDMRTLTETLDRAEHERRVVSLSIERTQSEITSEQQQLMQALAAPVTLPTAPELNLLDFDLQLENNERTLNLQLDNNTSETERAREEHEILVILYEQGVVPRQNLTESENELARLIQAREQIISQGNHASEDLVLRRQQAIQNYESAASAYDEAVEAAYRNNQQQIESRRSRISQLEFTLTAHNFELERVETQISDLAQQIADGGIMEVHLPPNTHGGRTISEYMPGISVGSNVSEGAAVMLTALNNNRFHIETSFPQVQDFIDTDQSVDIIIGSERLTGRTIRIIPQGGRNNVTIEVQSGSLRGGELASVIVSGGNTNHANIVPLSALREDQNGFYILYVEAVPRRFGNSYYVRAIRVEPGRRDTNNASISPSWGVDIPEEPIIINSDMPVQPNDRVRIVG